MKKTAKSAEIRCLTPLYISVFFSCLLVFACSLVQRAYSVETPALDRGKNARIMFLPFQIHTKKDEYAYLRDGLAGMLASRVAARARVEVLHDTDEARKVAASFRLGKEQQGIRLLKKLSVDYLVLGSMSEKNPQELELAVAVLGSDKGAGARRFVRHPGSIDEVLPVMDELAWEVAGLFGAQRPEKAPGPSAQQAELDAFQTEHPERAYKKGMYAGLLPGFETGDYRLLSSQRSQRLDFGSNDMQVGDLDGDGVDELVLAGGHEVRIYRFDSGRFAHVRTIDLPSYLRIHAVSLADLDDNGIMEIYASANNRHLPQSVVIEWDGKRERILAKDLPWYLRVSAPAGKPVLIGQKAEAFAKRLALDQRAWILMRDAQGGYEKGEEIALPKGLTIFHVSWADLNGDGRPEMIVLDRALRLQIRDQLGKKVLWTGEGEYGASSNYLGTMSTVEKGNKIYVPPAPAFSDLNGDGRPDLILVKNRRKVIKYFKQYQYFEGSSLAALSWKQGKLVSLWETKRLPDYTVACDTGKPGMDGENEVDGTTLFFAQGQSNYSFGFWQEKTTALFRYVIAGNAIQKRHGSSFVEPGKKN